MINFCIVEVDQEGRSLSNELLSYLKGPVVSLGRVGRT